MNLVTILDNLRIPRVIGLGDGAGANIITRFVSKEEQTSKSSFRFGLAHPNRVLGLVTINNTATVSLGRFMDRIKVI